jgi:hypothetical protein
VAVNSIYASIIPSYKYNLVLKSFSYGTQVMGHPVCMVFCPVSVPMPHFPDQCVLNKNWQFPECFLFVGWNGDKLNLAPIMYSF